MAPVAHGNTPPAGPGPAPANPVAPGQPIRWINVKTFELDYKTDSVGPSGINRVELWGTPDGGQTWRLFATADGRGQPISVSVDEDGVYGFRLAVQNRLGLGNRSPQRGDAPEISVGMDTIKPTALITGFQPGIGPDAGKAIISWEAGDNRKLAVRPIAISCRDPQSGNWFVLANGLDNTGRFVWQSDRPLPPRLDLRLEVRDEAGNVAVSEMSK